MRLLTSLIISLMCFAAAAAEARLQVDQQGKCSLTAGETAMIMTGYPDTKNGGGSPFYSFEVKTGDKWQPQMMGWCGTGAGAFTLDAGKSMHFNVHLGNINGGEARVVLHYKDATGNNKVIKSNSLDLGTPKLGWVTLSAHGDCLFKTAAKPVVITGDPDSNGVVSSPTYTLEYKKGDEWVEKIVFRCGTGQKSRQLKAHETISFKIEKGKIKKHKMRVVVYCADADGNRHKIVSNSVQ